MSYAHRVSPGEKVKLCEISTSAPKGLDKAEGLAKTAKLAEDFMALEDELQWAGSNGCLIVLQGMDAAGKDGAARHILGLSNSISARVASFKRPTEEELAHDFLWRVHRQVPRKGEIVIFNRSHYEDVLVVKVHELAPSEVIEGRYDHVNHFERLLADSGCLIFKFFLHISKDEQEKRFLEREADPKAAWKLAAADWKEREHWDDYQSAFEAALTRCPGWQIIPSDHKWMRNLAITEALVEGLAPHREEWEKRLEKIGEEAKAELAEYRRSQI